MKNLLLMFLFLVLLHCKPTEKNMSTATLENTYWKLLEVNGRPLLTPADAREVHMILTNEDAGRRLKGFAGCNNMGGSYTVNGDMIRFTVISTKMMCSPDRMEPENFLFDVLNNADHFKIKGERLELYKGDTRLTVFESVYLK
jgi:heat shock protein HslJ